MKRDSSIVLVAAILFCAGAVAAPLAAQQQASASPGRDILTRSKSAGFFLGGGLDGDGIADSNDNSTESGGGASLVIGYGFSPRWSLYSEFSGATMNAADGFGTYSLAHFDLGTRIHFRTGPNVVVPFLQFAVSGRAISADVDGTTVTGSGAGFTFGAGLNAHFTPAVAFSTAVTWTAGDFDKFQVGSQVVSTNASVNATSARIHLGIVWFAQ